MKKHFLFSVIMLAIISTTSCGNNSEPDYGTYENEESQTDSSAESGYDSETDSEEVANYSSFPFSVEDVQKAIAVSDYEYHKLESTSYNGMAVDEIEVGQSQSFHDTNTHIYLYYESKSDDIIGVQILCADLANSTMEDVFLYSFNAIFNDMGFYWSDVTSTDKIKNNVHITGTAGDNDGSQWINVIAYIDGYDFSDDRYYKASFISPENSSIDYPVVTYEDILTGEYNGKYVYIDAIIDNIDVSSYSTKFSLWYPYGDTYYYDTGNFSDIEEDSPESVFKNAKNGDVIHFSTQIYNDGSFGTNNVYTAEITGSEDILSVRQKSMDNSPSLDYEGVERNPDSFKRTQCSFSGTIFQIVKEDNYSAEYIVETDSGYVYVNWYASESIRGSRLLEWDYVTVFGTIDGLKTYDTLTGENTVPYIQAAIVALN